MFLLFYIPIDVCFHCDIPLFLHLFITSFFLLDIILNFNTGYFYKGFMVANRKTIAKHYISNLFLWDGLTAFILLFDYNFHIYFTEKDTNVNFYKFLFFFRIKTFKSLYNRLLEKFRVSIRVHTSLIELFNLLFVSSIILHLFACFWYYLAFVHSDNPDYETWLTNKQLLSESIANKYIHSLYWSAVTIMTVGYGDIVAYNTEEVCFVIFTVLVGCIVFAYIINSIGMIVGEIDKQNIMFKYVL